jgi:PAS domain S-box-containing protein
LRISGVVGILAAMTLRGAAELVGIPSRLDFLRPAVVHSVNGFVFGELDGRVSWANASFLRMLGYTDPSEVHGTHVRELIDPPSRAEEILSVLHEKGVWLGEVVARRRGGETLHVEALATLVRDETGHPLGLMGSIVDITERLRAKDAIDARETALRESVERLHQAVRVAEIGIFDHDQLRDTVYWSPRQREMYGFGADEVVTLEGFFVRVLPEDRERIRAAVALAHDPAIGKKFDVEHRIIRRDGAVRWVRTRSQTFFDDTPGARRPLRTVGAVLDITESRRGEEERASLQAQLHQAQKMESIGRLAGGVAHDFNNMLAVILGYAELIKRRLPADSRVAEDAAEIANAATRARDVTRQLLAFSRKQIIDPRPVDVNELVRETHKALARLIGEDIVLTFAPAADLWTVELDPTQVDSILMNLVVNARDALPRGGSLTVATANVRVDEDPGRGSPKPSRGEYVVLRVTDDGVGMNAETRSHAFEPFFTTKGPGLGTGLGLATVYGIVAQNGGFIELDSEEGRGTTLRLYFPRHHGQSPTAVTKHDDVRLVPGQGRVLVVEDEAMVRNVTQAMVESLGYEVIAVASAAAALEVAANPDERIDVMLTDLVMPDMNGMQLRDRVQTLRPKLPVVLMSGYAASSVASHGVLEEGIELLQKPISLHDLAQKLRG